MPSTPATTWNSTPTRPTATCPSCWPKAASAKKRSSVRSSAPLRSRPAAACSILTPSTSRRDRWRWIPPRAGRPPTTWLRSPLFCSKTTACSRWLPARTSPWSARTPIPCGACWETTPSRPCSSSSSRRTWIPVTYTFRPCWNVSSRSTTAKWSTPAASTGAPSPIWAFPRAVTSVSVRST